MINQQIKDRISGISGKIGIYYKDLSSGYSLFEGNTDQFVAAGLAKLLLLVELFSEFHHNRLNPAEIYRLKNSDKMPSIGALISLHEGIDLTISDLYQLMITVGDNSAFNILTKKLGFSRINETLSDLGYEYSRINRYFFDMDAIRNGVENYTSVSEIGDLLERLFNGQLISHESSKKLLELLKLQQRNYIIPYHFSEMVEIAHQVGEDEGILHDVGIIFSKKPFILCMSANDVDVRKTESAMRDVALMCFQFSNKINL